MTFWDRPALIYYSIVGIMFALLMIIVAIHYYVDNKRWSNFFEKVINFFERILRHIG